MGTASVPLPHDSGVPRKRRTLHGRRLSSCDMLAEEDSLNPAEMAELRLSAAVARSGTFKLRFRSPHRRGVFLVRTVDARRNKTRLPHEDRHLAAMMNLMADQRRQHAAVRRIDEAE